MADWQYYWRMKPTWKFVEIWRELNGKFSYIRPAVVGERDVFPELTDEILNG